jgi:hypothetical protein
MERVTDLTHIVQQEIQSYAGSMLKGSSYMVSNSEQNIFAVVDVPDHYPRKFPVSIAVMARIVGNHVLIDEDTTDRPLVEELVRAGIPREQIICTYIGESLPQET